MEFKTEKEADIYGQGRKDERQSIKLHNQPSEGSLKMFKTMNDKIDKLADKIETVLVRIAELPEEIFEKANKKYASKRVEIVVYGMIAIVLIAVFGSIVNNVIQNDNNKLNEKEIIKIIENNYNVK